MEMFIDVQCPVCQAYEVDNLPTVVKDNIANGKVQLHLKPWAFLGPQSFTGRYGVIAAAKQNKGFEYAKVLYDNQRQEESGWLTGREMAIIAASVDGLNLAQWQADVNSSASKDDRERRRRRSPSRRRSRGRRPSSSAARAASSRTSRRPAARRPCRTPSRRSPPPPAIRRRARSGGSAQRARFSCLTSGAMARLGSASRFRWTSRFVGAGVFVVRPTASVHSRAP